MITITVKKRNGAYVSFVSKGHAGYAEEGYDIICAAVSALIINTVNSIDTFTEDQLKEKEDDGFVSFEFLTGPSEKSTLLMDSLLLGLTQIENSYQKRYLRVNVREV
ncbi:MAG: ribosomal-processing cysteine protease Prp [Clostridiales bacterium]|nr:ribosomal-processing cysteine protease Prp [Candidatus Blautia equi]